MLFVMRSMLGIRLLGGEILKASQLVKQLQVAIEDYGDLAVTMKNLALTVAEEVTDINIYCDDVNFPLYAKKNGVDYFILE